MLKSGLPWRQTVSSPVREVPIHTQECLVVINLHQLANRPPCRPYRTLQIRNEGCCAFTSIIGCGATNHWAPRQQHRHIDNVIGSVLSP